MSFYRCVQYLLYLHWKVHFHWSVTNVACSCVVDLVIKTNHSVASEINTFAGDSSRLLIKPPLRRHNSTKWECWNEIQTSGAFQHLFTKSFQMDCGKIQISSWRWIVRMTQFGKFIFPIWAESDLGISEYFIFGGKWSEMFQSIRFPGRCEILF